MGPLEYALIALGAILAILVIIILIRTLTFRPKGGEEVTLTEAVGSGSNLSWFGGASSGVSLTGYTSYYPAAPTE